jgi:hypothetical protein
VVLTFSSVALAQDLQPPPPMTGGQDTQPQQQQPQQPQQQQPQQQLAPPPPIQQPPPPPDSTTQRLDDSKKQDSGRGLEIIYLNVQGGGVFDALGTFSNTLQLQNTNGGGLMVGAEAGVRFVWFTLGARFRYDMLSPFNIWQLDAVAGFHVPAGNWDPYVSIHGGYSAIGSLDPSSFNASQIAPCSTCTTQDAANGFSTKGANVGFAIGADYYFARFISLGIEGSFELIFLHRDPLAIPDACLAVAACSSSAMANPLYNASGDAAGVSLIGSVHLALHL